MVMDIIPNTITTHFVHLRATCIHGCLRQTVMTSIQSFTVEVKKLTYI